MSPSPYTEVVPDEPEPHSRRARLETRQRRYRWAAVSAGALVLGAVAIAAAFVSTDDAPAAPNGQTLTGISTGDTTSTSSPATGLPATTPMRALSHAEPLRLWVGGDSLAGALGPALGELAGATGIVATNVDYKVSSGLIPGPRDWEAHAAEAMTSENPEAVVFMIGTNDADVVNSSDGDGDGDGVDDWEPEYRERVVRMMDLLAGPDRQRTVMWIGAPTMRDSDRDEAVVEVNRVAREEAAKRAPQVMYVDAYALFGDEGGDYTDRLETDEGSVRVRVGDGVHLTPAGAAYLAEPVFGLLDARYRLLRQADPTQPIRYTIADGGESYDSGSSDGDDDGSDDGSYDNWDEDSDNGSDDDWDDGSSTATTEPEVIDEVTPETDAPEPPPTNPPATTPPTSPTTGPPSPGGGQPTP